MTKEVKTVTQLGTELLVGNGTCQAARSPPQHSYSMRLGHELSVCHSDTPDA